MAVRQIHAAVLFDGRYLAHRAVGFMRAAVRLYYLAHSRSRPD